MPVLMNVLLEIYRKTEENWIKLTLPSLLLLLSLVLPMEMHAFDLLKTFHKFRYFH